MNQAVFIVVFVLAVLVLGLAIFFYWRMTYGVWAQRRSRGSERPEHSETIRYD